MRIGEIAKRTGLNISNIRFYERKGLLAPKREQDRGRSERGAALSAGGVAGRLACIWL